VHLDLWWHAFTGGLHFASWFRGLAVGSPNPRDLDTGPNIVANPGAGAACDTSAKCSTHIGTNGIANSGSNCAASTDIGANGIASTDIGPNGIANSGSHCGISTDIGTNGLANSGSHRVASTDTGANGIANSGSHRVASTDIGTSGIACTDTGTNCVANNGSIGIANCCTDRIAGTNALCDISTLLDTDRFADASTSGITSSTFAGTSRGNRGDDGGRY